MVLSLQEISYIQLSSIEREKIPAIVGNAILKKLKERIVKIWRKSSIYRIKYIRNCFKNKFRMSRASIIYLIYHTDLEGKPTLYNLIDYIHCYFHNHSMDRYISNREMNIIFDMFREKSEHNAHNFFGALWGILINSKEIPVDYNSFQKVFSIFTTNEIKNIYEKSL